MSYYYPVRHQVHFRVFINYQNDNETGDQEFWFDDGDTADQFEAEMEAMKRECDQIEAITADAIAGRMMNWLLAWQGLSNTYAELPRDVNGRKQRGTVRMGRVAQCHSQQSGCCQCCLNGHSCG